MSVGSLCLPPPCCSSPVLLYIVWQSAGVVSPPVHPIPSLQHISHQSSQFKMVALPLMITALLLLQQQLPLAAGGDPGAAQEEEEELRYRRHRGFHHSHHAPPRPTVPVQAPPPPATPCSHSFAPDESLNPWTDGDCVPTPAPPVPSPPAPAPPRSPRCPPCTCPAPKPPVVPPRPFPGWPGGNAGTGTDCVAPLAELATCFEFVMGNETETPAPTSQCCTGLAAFFRTAAGHNLHCLCPVIRGQVNKSLPEPIDAVRLMQLPITCGVLVPPQLLFICFGGQQQTPHP